VSLPPKLDTEWLYNTWGAGFKINNLYDGTFVLDEHFNVLWGSFQSQPFTETNLVFWEGLKALIDKHSNALSKEKNIYAGITRTRTAWRLWGLGLSARWSEDYRLTGYAALSGHYPPSEFPDFIRSGGNVSDR
jgi:hypothetical protein